MSEEQGPYDQPVQVDPALSTAVSSVGGGNEFGPAPDDVKIPSTNGFNFRQAEIDSLNAYNNQQQTVNPQNAGAGRGSIIEDAGARTAATNSGSASFRQTELDSMNTLNKEEQGPVAPDAKTLAATTSKPADNNNFLTDALARGLGSAAQNYLSGTGAGGLLNAFNNNSSLAGLQILNQGQATGNWDTSGSLLNSQNNNIDIIKSNILHNYVNTTYRISLYAITRDAVNSIYDGNIKPGSAKNILAGAECIIADSGINESVRSVDFPVDMGIDNLELESIVGAHTRTRNTDVIHIKFDIIEPYTAVLFARMRKLNARFNPNGGWNTMFFCMVIEWYGYNNNGKQVKVPRTRYIPFTFVNMKMKVTNSGAVYNCTAIPASNTAMSILDNTIPFHVELQGSTIKDIFNAANASYVAQSTGSGARDSNTTISTGQTGGNAPTTSTVNKGLAEALNYSQKELCDKKNNGQSKPNTFILEFDPALANATISNPTKFKEQSLAMSSGKGNEQKTAIQNGKTGVLTLDTTKDVFRAQSGTKITDLINACLSVSSYMTSQWKPGGQDNQTPLNLWKIIPSVRYLDIDPSTNYYQRIIKYTVIPYSMKGQDAPNFPSGVPDDSEVMRSYEYIFTGQNRDVISVDLDFKMSFFEVRNGTPANAVVNANDSPNPDSKSPENYLQTKTTGGFKPRYHFSHGLANRQNTGATADTYADIDVQNLMEKIFDNGVDLLSLNIEIVGDPDWISQDNILYGKVAGNGSKLADGSINFSKEQYFDFFFFSPTSDYNDSTGLFGSDGDYADFSGRYRVISVKSKFTGGKFTQQLKNVRLRNQTNSTSGSNRSDTINTDSVGSSSGAGSANYLPSGFNNYGVAGSSGIRGQTFSLTGQLANGIAGGLVSKLLDTTSSRVPSNAKSGSTADQTVDAPNTDTKSPTDPNTGAALDTSKNSSLAEARQQEIAAVNTASLPSTGASIASARQQEIAGTQAQDAVNNANQVTSSTQANPDRYVTETPATVVAADTGSDPYVLGGSASSGGISEDSASNYYQIV